MKKAKALSVNREKSWLKKNYFGEVTAPAGAVVADEVDPP